ncbi:MAG: hypothetical protein SNJ64_00195, partial [Endomicrobiia bacterium]
LFDRHYFFFVHKGNSFLKKQFFIKSDYIIQNNTIIIKRMAGRNKKLCQWNWHAKSVAGSKESSARKSRPFYIDYCC